jgi:hypothetical protein
LPDNSPVSFARRGDQIVFRPLRLETLQVLSVEFA